ncbi:hypothetical protein C8Q75DRAFT_731445 [Abortiporus biennis]|nr:hypothetical protein C8Q75DRAFT_731445 [Abortiporus biennis]
MSNSKSALILGATGATGRHLLRELLQSPNFTRVGEYGRKVTSAADITAGKEKLEQRVIDFEQLDQAGLKDGKWDVVFITLGTTRKAAGSAANFEKIDREYVVNAAKLAKLDDPAHPQRIVYLSSVGANAQSYLLYPRSKGLTENELSKLGYKDTIIFRPAMLTERNNDHRLGESIVSGILGLSSFLSDKYSAPVSYVAKAMRIAGEVGSDKLPAAAEASKAGPPETPFTLINNAGVRGLATSEK